MPASIHQLSDGDAIFLAMETPNALGHMGALTILDPSSNPGFSYQTLAERIDERLALVPRFSWKLAEVPLGLDRPYWTRDHDFDISRHLRRAALPSPGGDRELADLAGHLHGLPLDRARPLWEMWLIEGLADGRFAIYMKTHHCLMDGASGAGLSEVLADLIPDATAPPIVPDAYREADVTTPAPLAVAAGVVRNAARRRVRFAEHARRGAKALQRSIARRDDEAAPIPRLFFNGSVGAQRALAWTDVELERVKALRKHFDVKVNDVVLEIVGSAMRRYLREREALPSEPLVALCPVSTRNTDDIQLDNQITSMAVSLATDSADAAERLRRIHASALEAKGQVEEGHFDPLTAIGETLAPGVVNLLMRGLGASAELAPLIGNFVVSNVRATPIPLYLAGARVERMMPMSLLQVGQGLNVTVVSYVDRIHVGFTYDPELVPDADRLAEHVEAALDELEMAAEGVVHRERSL